MVKCEGCQEEMETCYEWQSKGYDAGLRWNCGCCFVFVLDKKGERIIW